jgi:nicotinamide phosphoribosyltransferase
MQFEINPILACDFYKVGHTFQYPEGTETIYSNLTARSNRLAPMYNGKQIQKIVFAGLQGFIKWFLIDSFNRNFFGKDKNEVIAEYSRRVTTSLALDSFDTSHISALHDLGYLPLEIKALPEGSVVGMKIPFITIKNTLPEFYWLTNYIETAMSAEMWKVITTATIAFEYKKLLQEFAVKTGSPLDFVLWQAHDFSMRGVGGIHDAAANSSGHLFSFLGTDTIPAIQYLEDFYNASNDFVGGSVPATEHSVMCAGGSDDELETIRRIIQDVHPSGVVSVVSDTWDYWNTITTHAANLKEVILNRKPNVLGLAKTVFRPDSGDPVEILCGIPFFETNEDTGYQDIYDSGLSVIFDYVDGKYKEIDLDIEYGYEGWYTIRGYQVIREIPLHEIKGSVEVLWDIFGGTVTETGHKLLDSHVGLIYGDSITLDRAFQILDRLEKKGFASANVVFGVGSFTYQYNTRDTFGMAMKATYAVVDGTGRELFKDPKTDSGTKKSAKGLLKVVDAGKDGKKFFVLVDQVTAEEEQTGELRSVFKDGKLLVDESLAEIRARLNSNL